MNQCATAALPEQIPSARFHYFDVVKFWLRNPLDQVLLKQVAEHCGGRPHLQNGCPFDARYSQRIDLYQPKPAALRLLASLDESLLNYVEIACDLVLADEAAARRYVEFFKDHFLQRWHRTSMPVAVYYKGPDLTGYCTRTSPEPGKRRGGTWFVCYSDRPCRITNDPHCFHAEIRIQGVQALRRMGIYHVRGLVDFNFSDYFVENLKLYELDLERLGRYEHNRRSGAKRKRPHVERLGRFTYNHDRRRGATVYRILSVLPDPNHYERSLQRFLDAYGPVGRRFLRPLLYNVYLTKSHTCSESTPPPASS